MNTSDRFDWNSETSQEAKEFVVLPENTVVDFTVVGFERATTAKGDNMAKLTLKCLTADGQEATLRENLVLSRRCEWRINQFFTCVGLRKHGERSVPKWNLVNGSSGKARLGVESWEGRDGKTYEGDYDYQMQESQGHPKFFSYKCSMQEGYPHLYSPLVSRLGEMYLIRAEAEAKLGRYADALEDLNVIRERSLPGEGYESLDATNAHERIMKERQLELCYEADRGFDVFRVGETMVRRYPGFHDGTNEYPADSPLAIQYIPQSEINAYPGTLTQNP